MRLIQTFIFCALIHITLSGHPLAFEQRSSNLYRARVGGENLTIDPHSVTLGDVVLRFENSSSTARLEGVGFPSPSTYLFANMNRTFPQYPKLAVRRLYAGVDVLFYGNGEHLEYDLIVSPGADLRRLRIHFDGARRIQLNPNGDLRVDSGSGYFIQTLPRVFQSDGQRIPATYRMLAKDQVGFRIGPHNPRLALTIDPELVLTTYFGGSGSDTATAIATDSQGNIYIAGNSNSVDFPSTTGNQPRPSAPMAAISGDGATITRVPVSTENRILSIGGSADGGVLYAVAPDAVFASSDHGATWIRRAPLPSTPSINGPILGTTNNISLDPLDPARVMVATDHGLFSSGDGGEHWNLNEYGIPSGQNGPPDVTSVLISPVDRSTIYLATAAPLGLFKLSSQGFGWTPLNPAYPGQGQGQNFQRYRIAFGPNGTDLYVIDPFGTLLLTTDGGTTWQRLAQQLTNASMLLVDPANASNIYVLDNVGIQKSTDGGATFSTLVPPTGIFGNVMQIALDSSSRTLYFGSANNSLYAVPTEGRTVKPLAIVTPNLHSLVNVGGQVYAGFDTPAVPYITKLDPTGTHILYSTFLGGTSQDTISQGTISRLAVDAQGNCTAAGFTSSLSGFITRLSADGTSLLYSKSLGGAQPSRGTIIQGLALDSTGAAYVTGRTSASDFPLSPNAFQSARPQPTCNRPTDPFGIPADVNGNAFVSKLSPDGSQIIYSTLITGSCGSSGSSIALDASNQAVIAGYTSSFDLPVTANSYQAAFPGDPKQIQAPNPLYAGFVAKISAAGDRLVAGTYLGGSYSTTANGVALDSSGTTYLTGSTAKILPGATPGAFQTTAVDRCVPPFFIGPSLPYTGTNDAFVLQLDPTLSIARYLTYLGGACNDSGTSIAIDSSGDAWVIGSTQSADFPLKNPFQGSGVNSRFLSEVSPDGSQLLFSSSTDGVAMAIDPAGKIHLAGSSSMPRAGVEYNKLDPSATTGIVIDNVQPVTSYPPAISPTSNLGNGLAPGELIRISGRNLGPATLAKGQFDATGRMPFSLGGTTVLFDNLPAALVSVQATEVICFVPFEVSQTANITLVSGGQRSSPVRVAITPVDLQVLTIVNQDGTLNSADHPAKAGDVLTFYVSGLGQTNPLSADGLVNTAPWPIPIASLLAFTVPITITPDFVGAAPGQVAGITQINLRLPATMGSSNPINLTLNNRVTVPVYVSRGNQ